MSQNLMNFFERNSAIFKVAAIAFLALMLLIPVSMIDSLVMERKTRQLEALEEVSAKWGFEQQVVGPILAVPYYTFDLNKDRERINMARKLVYLLPEQLDISGTINPEIRYRGLFKVPVYRSDIRLDGHFSVPDMGITDTNTEIDWAGATITLGISDMRGITEAIDFGWNNEKMDCEPGVSIENIVKSGITVSNPLDLENKTESYRFSINISLNGSKAISFVPLGKQTTAKINSSWKDPSFNGAFLPASRDISAQGFSATWKVLELNRNYPQRWTEKNVDLASSAFGIELILPGDTYQLTERSIKYAILFITLTFMSFFFIEIIHKQRVHPIQYILVGFGLALFYLLLLSLSEHIGFNLSYLIASTAIVAMITGYSKSIFKNNKLIALMASILIVLYGFLFILLQMQDLTLLIGSAGLFIILSSVMYMSRKIDWYNIGAKDEGNE
jgi:inner membrane protein